MPPPCHPADICPLATLGLQAPRTSHGMHSQSGYRPPPYIGTDTRGLFPDHNYNFMTLPHPTPPTPTTLGVGVGAGVGVAPIQKHPVSHDTHTHGPYGPYPYLPFSSPPFDPMSLPPPNILQAQPTTDIHLDWLSSLAGAGAPHHQYTSPTILVSPADGNYSTFTGPKAVPERATTFFAASAATDTCVNSSYSNIGPVPVPVHFPYGAPGSPFNSLGASTGLTPIFSSTPPSTFDLSATPGLSQPSPAVPCSIRPTTEDLEGERGLDLVGLFSGPPSLPCGNFTMERSYPKEEAPHAPSGGNLLTIPLSTPQLAFTDHNRRSEFGIHTPVLPRRAPYARGRKEVRFPNQKKVNAVEDMCKWFPEESDFGKLLKRICASEWYHNGELEPTFGSGSEELTAGLALGFEVGYSILLGFVGKRGKCHYCGRVISKRDRIVAHVREHLGLRPFVCTDDQCTCRELPV